MRLGDPKSVLAVVLATICACHGKGQVGHGAAEGEARTVNQEPAKEEPAKEEPGKAELRVVEPEPKVRPQNRFEVDRVGWVKAQLGGRALDLPVLPATQNRVAIHAKPPLVIVDGYATENGGEHLRVHMQGVEFERSKGRPLLPVADNKSWLVAVTYQDATGKTWVGKVGTTPGVQVKLDQVDIGTQVVSGTFSGQLREANGDALLDLREGSFKTGLKG